MPRILILAGPNGAGKTTFARTFLSAEAQCPRFINADLIAAGLSPFDPDAAAVRAGRLMLEEIAAAVQRRASFALETTLSSQSYLRQIPAWQELGYAVSLYFIRLPAADYSVLRVAERVKRLLRCGQSLGSLRKHRRLPCPARLGRKPSSLHRRHRPSTKCRAARLSGGDATRCPRRAPIGAANGYRHYPNTGRQTATAGRRRPAPADGE